MQRNSILVVEDDTRTSKLICQILQKEGYKTKAVDSIFKAQGEVQRIPPDLVILDRRLPDGDGLEFCRQLRSTDKTKTFPVLFLTSKDGTADRVVGLKMGGDDYLTKPFQSEELLARIEALFRRVQGNQESSPTALSAHGIVLNLDTHECLVGRTSVNLWPKEFELLQTFMERPGRVLSKEFLSERVWGHEVFPTSRAIEIAVQRLRKKLGAKGSLIETVKAYGYKLKEK